MSTFIEDPELAKLFSDFLTYLEDPIYSQGEVKIPSIVIPSITKTSNISRSLPLSKETISQISKKLPNHLLMFMEQKQLLIIIFEKDVN